MITRVSCVIRPKGSDLIFDHPYDAEYARGQLGRQDSRRRADQPVMAPLRLSEFR
jgi:hypothetical protein